MGDSFSWPCHMYTPKWFLHVAWKQSTFLLSLQETAPQAEARMGARRACQHHGLSWDHSLIAVVFTATHCSVLGWAKAECVFCSYRARLLDDIHKSVSWRKTKVAPLESALNYHSWILDLQCCWCRWAHQTTVVITQDIQSSCSATGSQAEQSASSWSHSSPQATSSNVIAVRKFTGQWRTEGSNKYHLWIEPGGEVVCKLDMDLNAVRSIASFCSSRFSNVMYHQLLRDQLRSLRSHFKCLLRNLC